MRRGRALRVALVGLSQRPLSANMSGGVLMLLPKFDESTKQIGAILAAKAAEKPPAAGAHPLKTELLQLCRERGLGEAADRCIEKHELVDLLQRVG